MSMYFAGYLFGAGLAGMLANWIGRRYSSMSLTGISAALLILNVIVTSKPL
jgi:MFS family permease